MYGFTSPTSTRGCAVYRHSSTGQRKRLERLTAHCPAPNSSTCFWSAPYVYCAYLHCTTTNDRLHARDVQPTACTCHKLVPLPRLHHQRTTCAKLNQPRASAKVCAPARLGDRALARRWGAAAAPIVHAQLAVAKGQLQKLPTSNRLRMRGTIFTFYRCRNFVANCFKRQAESLLLVYKHHARISYNKWAMDHIETVHNRNGPAALPQLQTLRSTLPKIVYYRFSVKVPSKSRLGTGRNTHPTEAGLGALVPSNMQAGLGLGVPMYIAPWGYRTNTCTCSCRHL